MKAIVFVANFFCSIILANSQTFNCGTSTVTDIDGNEYHTVQIGSQCWMKENMRTTRYATGQLVDIPRTSEIQFQETVNLIGELKVRISLTETRTLHVNIYNFMAKLIYHEDLTCYAGSSLLECVVGPGGMYVIQINGAVFKVSGGDRNTTWVSLFQNAPMTRLTSDTIVLTANSRNYFDYDNDPSNGIKYGKLYTALSALNGVRPPYPAIIQGICPNDWHVANDSDWMKMEITAGMWPNTAHLMMQYRGSISNKLKIAGTEWYFGDGTDEIGFSAKGSGCYDCNVHICTFDLLTEYCIWWTYNNDWLLIRELTDFDAGVWRGFNGSENWAISVRCVKN